MIPPDVATALRQTLPELQSAAKQQQTQPLLPIQRIADVLGDLVPGQRILAEIQALLPNGSYRAVVAQRDITLALPFSAKAGDTLELEVAESDGHLTLAFVANRTASDARALAQESVPTSLSSTGKLIGQLIGDAEGGGKRAPAAPLNGSQPMVANMPDVAAELAPVLKQAVSQSGVFYEAHQARWIAGELPLEALRQEPQGKLEAHAPPLSQTAPTAPAAMGEATVATGNNSPLARADRDGTAIASPQSQVAQTGGSNAHSPAIRPDGQIPQEVAGLVRQQLDGLANNNFAWQGQIWPGQQMRWEIGENPEQRRSIEQATGSEWQSRLKLTLPSLGEIDASLRLQPGGRISLSVTANSEEAEERLRQQTDQLLKQFSSAGLDLTQLQIQHGQADA